MGIRSAQKKRKGHSQSHPLSGLRLQAPEKKINGLSRIKKIYSKNNKIKGEMTSGQAHKTLQYPALSKTKMKDWMCKMDNGQAICKNGSAATCLGNTLIHNNQSRKPTCSKPELPGGHTALPSNNPESQAMAAITIGSTSQDGMTVEASLIFVTSSNLGLTRESRLCTPNQSHGTPTSS